MDLHDDWENALSSEEYSDDDLMNAAVGVNKKFEASEVKPSAKILNNISPYKRQAMKSRNKLQKYASMVKKRSVTWLNTKTKRDKYKKLILKSVKENKMEETSLINVYNKTNGSNEISLIQKETPSLNLCSQELSPKLINLAKDNMEISKNAAVQNDEFKKQLMSCEIRQIKRSASVPPTLVNQKCKTMDDETNMSRNRLLFNEVNKLFPKYNKVLKDFVSSSTNSIESIEMKISEILTEIQDLSEIIQTKEFEWNKLLHLRKVKEEIIMQLARKKCIMELNTNQIVNKNLKMSKSRKIDSYSSRRSINSFEQSGSHQSTAQALVEHRANMNREDLEKEKSNINKLHSIFVSKNILLTSKCTDVPKTIPDAPYHTSVSESFEKVAMKTFQQNNTDIMERRNNKIQMCDDNISNHCSMDEMQLRRIHVLQRNDDDSTKRSNRHFFDSKQDLNENKVPLCQACKSHKSRFLCAGCANQWYCSRKCQISDWDQHSDSCKE